ncbi:MAG: hypothetical protein Udaeo2_21700 [Candidatus Udaeobacter sp.]|nr:MAG: hypothetical protein Udaeo2_21700 [Candidatus Udaeobacter sp.]
MIGRADPTAGFTAQSDICEAPVVLFMREAEPIAVLLKPLLEKSAKVTDRGVAAARNVAVHSLITKSYVIKAGLIQKQGMITGGGIVVAVLDPSILSVAVLLLPVLAASWPSAVLPLPVIF